MTFAFITIAGYWSEKVDSNFFFVFRSHKSHMEDENMVMEWGEGAGFHIQLIVLEEWEVR